MSKGHSPGDYRIILSCCPNIRVAKRIAFALVNERLAACVNIVPVRQSIYRWRGKVKSATEVLMVIKARAGDYRRVEKRLRSLHPYELPEIVSVRIANGYSRYLAWMENPDEV
jgi:periplasmic divalent cation tolerance protein